MQPQNIKELRDVAQEQWEGMPGTWSHCGRNINHPPHRYTVVFNEGPYDNILCKGYPGDQMVDGQTVPLGRIVYDDPR